MKIDSHIPPPAGNSAPRGRPGIYPFARMEIGDSFAVSASMKDKLGSAAVKWKRRHPGWDYRTQISGDDIRLWRIA